jgi:type I restriction enzyme S subunit
MASDWQTVPIGSLCEGIFDGPHATPKKTGDGPVFLGISSLLNGRLDLTDPEHLSEEDYKKWTRRVVPHEGDIVFSYETRLGEAALIPKGLKCCLGRRLGLLRIDTSKADPQFLLYAYISPAFQQTLKERTIHGSTVDRLPLIEFGEFPIAVAQLPEQRAIARTLGTIDGRIDLLHETNEALEAMAQAIFKSWLVDFDPVKAKAEGREPECMDASTAALFPCELEDSNLGPIPRGWNTISVYDIADFSNGAAFRSSHFSNAREGLPVIKIAELKAGVSDTTRFTTSQLDARFRIAKNEILFSWSGNPETSIDTFIWPGSDAWLNQHVFRVRRDGCYPRAFIFCQLRYLKPMFTRIAANKQTTGLGHVTVADMKRIQVAAPTTVVLDKFEEIVGQIMIKIELNLEQIEVLTSLRDTLLPKLMSGQLRLPEAETAVVA